MDEQDLTRRAIAAYYRSGKGDPMSPPSKYSGLVAREGLHYIVLRNANGVLAVYRVRSDGMLKALKRWPSELVALGPVTDWRQ
jgi:hypothetical protein